MSSREEKILNNEFFLNRQDLANQIISFEKDGKGYLPNQFAFKLTTSYEVNGNQIGLGRIHDFYFLSIENQQGVIRHQLFENESSCIQFFTKFDELTDKQLAFWLNQIELLR